MFFVQVLRYSDFNIAYDDTVLRVQWRNFRMLKKDINVILKTAHHSAHMHIEGDFTIFLKIFRWIFRRRRKKIRFEITSFQEIFFPNVHVCRGCPHFFLNVGSMAHETIPQSFLAHIQFHPMNLRIN